MSVKGMGPPIPPIPPLSSSQPSSTPWAGDAMDTLKMKIGLLKRESGESANKMAAAEKAKAEAEERIKIAENKTRELSKQIHARKILLDANTDKHQRNSQLARRKEEATLAAREEINNLTLREMALKSELERVSAALPDTSANLHAASERADKQLSEVKKLEIRAMLADQTIEEMEQQIQAATSMAVNSTQKREEMSRRLEVRQQELRRAQERADRASNQLQAVNDKLRTADRKMAGLQYNLEDRGRKESKYKKQINLLQARTQDAEGRQAREVNNLLSLKQNVEIRMTRAKGKEVKKGKK